MKSTDYWYLSSPYTKYPHGVEAAFKLVAENRALLIAADVPCFSPICHSHPVAIAGHLDPLDHKIWMRSERPMMESAYGIILLCAETWEDSIGMRIERAWFQMSLKPVVFMQPGIVPQQVKS